MEIPKYKIALIVGAGEGLSASLARLFAREGIRVALAARGIEKLGALCAETGARAFACDSTNAEEVERLFGMVEREIGTPDVVVYNASGRARGAFLDLVPAEVARSIAVSGFGGFLVAQQAVRRMLPQKQAPSCSRGRRRASKAIRNRRRSRWASLRYADWRRAWRANCHHKAFTSRILSLTAAFAALSAPNLPSGRIRCLILMPLP